MKSGIFLAVLGFLTLAIAPTALKADSAKVTFTIITSNERSVFSADDSTVPANFRGQNWLALSDHSVDISVRIDMKMNSGFLGLDNDSASNATSLTTSYQPGRNGIKGYSLGKIERIGSKVYLSERYELEIPKAKEEEEEEEEEANSVEVDPAPAEEEDEEVEYTKSTGFKRYELEFVEGTMADLEAGRTVILQLSSAGVRELKDKIAADARQQAVVNQTGGAKASVSVNVKTLNSSKKTSRDTRGRIITDGTYIEYEKIPFRSDVEMRVSF